MQLVCNIKPFRVCNRFYVMIRENDSRCQMHHHDFTSFKACSSCLMAIPPPRRKRWIHSLGCSECRGPSLADGKAGFTCLYVTLTSLDCLWVAHEVIHGTGPRCASALMVGMLFSQCLPLPSFQLVDPLLFDLPFPVLPCIVLFEIYD